MNESEKLAVVSWIEESMQEKGLTEMKIDLENTDIIGQGYAADIVFAKVTGTNKDNTREEINIVLKMGRRSECFREKQPIMRECYKRELLFYERVLPTFRKFQSDKNVNTFASVPKCYKTFLTDDMEVVVLENLKTKGFAMLDYKYPMNLNHIKLVLENYAQFHAISFALRDQNEHEFNETTADHFALMKQMILTFGLNNNKDKALENLKKTGRDDLAVRYGEVIINRSKETILLEVLDDMVKESVVTHGDCHVGNFMFKYKDDCDSPEGVAIIDWQLSDLHSPVLDLSYFLYGSASGEDLSQLGELTRFYHGHLARYLKDLGSDAEKLFPYSTLIEHWEKYSIYGFIFLTTFLEVYYIDKENTPSYDELKNHGGMNEILSVAKLNNEELYIDRLISVVEHYCNYKLT